MNVLSIGITYLFNTYLCAISRLGIKRNRIRLGIRIYLELLLDLELLLL